jgi:Asparagine synthase
VSPADPETAPSPYPERLRPTPLEVASGLALGVDDGSPRVVVRGAPHPRAAIEALVRSALRHPPCLVSFSGGRDSSSVLAVAAAVARREGLPLPVPATLCFPAAPGSHETEWQELVVRHLALPDWERIQLTTELDLVGPVAGAVLRRHGVLWPPVGYLHVPIFERAAGGTVLTGAGGDEILSRGAFSHCRGRGWIRRSNLRTIAVAMAPSAVRSRVFARQRQPPSPWLLAGAEAELNRVSTAYRGRSPDRWGARIAWWWRSRYRATQAASLAVLAADADSRVVNVFLEPSVAGALGHHYGLRGPTSREAAIGELFGDVVPATLVTRRTKAFFDEAILGEQARSFAGGWDGTGVDPTLVHIDRLAFEWRLQEPNVRTSLLLQQAWLAAS